MNDDIISSVSDAEEIGQNIRRGIKRTLLRLVNGGNTVGIMRGSSLQRQLTEFQTRYEGVLTRDSEHISTIAEQFAERDREAANQLRSSG